jgi:hypothetical protein
MDTKVNTNSDAINYIRKEIENLMFAYKKLQQSMTSTNLSSDSCSILTTKKLYPFN